MKTILFVFATLLPGSVVSQVLLWDKVCVPGPGGYDISPAGTRAGDHDGDGLEDVLCPLFMRDAVTGYFMPQWTYVVLSSRTGKVLARQDIGYGDVANMNPVFHEGVGDFDGDRHLDWILSLTYSSGQIQLRSFSDVPVRSIPFSLPDNAAACGRAIAANLDLDGDGRPDLVTTLI